MDKKNKLETAPASHVKSVTAERRRSERFPFSAMAQLMEVGSHLPVTVRIADIGRHGCYADTIAIFPMGANARLLIQHSNTQFEIGVTISYVLPGMGIGLSFEPLPPAMESILDRWLAEVNGATAPQPKVEESKPTIQKSPRAEQHILSRLISLMMSKSLLTQKEGVELLDELLHDK